MVCAPADPPRWWAFPRLTLGRGCCEPPPYTFNDCSCFFYREPTSAFQFGLTCGTIACPSPCWPPRDSWERSHCPPSSSSPTSQHQTLVPQRFPSPPPLSPRSFPPSPERVAGGGAEGGGQPSIATPPPPPPPLDYPRPSECRNVPPPQGRPYPEEKSRGRVMGWGKGKQNPISHFAGTAFF